MGKRLHFSWLTYFDADKDIPIFLFAYGIEVADRTLFLFAKTGCVEGVDCQLRIMSI